MKLNLGFKNEMGFGSVGVSVTASFPPLLPTTLPMVTRTQQWLIPAFGTIGMIRTGAALT